MDSSHYTDDDAQSVDQRSFLNISADTTPQVKQERREGHKANIVASILNPQTQKSKKQN